MSADLTATDSNSANQVVPPAQQAVLPATNPKEDRASDLKILEAELKLKWEERVKSFEQELAVIRRDRYWLVAAIGLAAALVFGVASIWTIPAAITRALESDASKQARQRIETDANAAADFRLMAATEAGRAKSEADHAKAEAHRATDAARENWGVAINDMIVQLSEAVHLVAYEAKENYEGRRRGNANPGLLDIGKANATEAENIANKVKLRGERTKAATAATTTPAPQQNWSRWYVRRSKRDNPGPVVWSFHLPADAALTYP